MTRLDDTVTDVAALGRALTRTAKDMQGSMILQIAAEVRALVASGKPMANLTVGDFDPKQFPIPAKLAEATLAALNAGQTNYPPSEGVPELRKAVSGFYKRHLGLDFGPEWVVVASGARPVMYATFRLFLEAGDELLFCAPSWNNGYYAQLQNAVARPLPTSAQNGFFPTAAELKPAIRTAQVFSLNSPLNPTGTVISADLLRGLAEVVAEENLRRNTEGRRPVIWMYDQVYWQLVFGEHRHAHPSNLVPEVAPYVVTVDAISKAFAATGLRVGWAVLAPTLAERMKALIGHVGAWAPRAEQVATAALLDDDAAVAAFGTKFRADLYERLHILHDGLDRLGVEHLVPQGAMYLSVRFDLFGRPGLDGQPMTTNDQVRKYLLERAGCAVVPFQAFDRDGDDGWFRISIGAIGTDALRAMLDRLGPVLAG